MDTYLAEMTNGNFETYLASSAERYEVATLKDGLRGLCLCCQTSSGVRNGP